MVNNNKINTIYSTKAKIVKHNKFLAKQFIITLLAPDIVSNIVAGQFIHIQCDKYLLLKRPMSIMLVDKDAGTIDLLYKIVGLGTQLLSKQKIGTELEIIAPIGNGFNISAKAKPLLLGGGVGMPPIIAIAQTIKDNNYYNPFVILGSEVPFPFTSKISNIAKNFTNANRTMALLEDWHISCRLTSMQNYDGVYQGYITDLAILYLDSLSADELEQIEIYACGPNIMLEAVAKLSFKYNLPCQISLEEYMACAVGGCAGCVVEVNKDSVKSMQKVCVDGPIFDARVIFND